MNISDLRMARQMRDLRKARQFVRFIVVIGIAASVAANVLGAEDFIASAISGWPPLALLLSLEVLTRVPTSKRLGAFGRVSATILVAGASGWLSYWHMAATVSQHGEHGGSQYVWPFTVDGLMTIAAIALVELGARIRMLELKQEEREALKDALTMTAPESVIVAATPTVVAAPAISAEPADISQPEPVADDAVSPSLPEAPVSPAISGRGEYGPRNGVEYSKRHQRRRKATTAK